MLVVAPHAPHVSGLHAPAARSVAIRPRQNQPAESVAPVGVAVFELNHVVFWWTKMSGRPGRSDDRTVSVPDTNVEVYWASHWTFTPFRPSGHYAIFWTRYGTRLGFGRFQFGAQRIMHHLLRTRHFLSLWISLLSHPCIAVIIIIIILSYKS